MRDCDREMDEPCLLAREIEVARDGGTELDMMWGSEQARQTFIALQQ